LSFSEIPPPPEVVPGQDEPVMRVRPPGAQSRSWLVRARRAGAPMGPPRSGSALLRGSIVYASARGCNVLDVDQNRYVDLAAGFGAMLIGHSHPAILRALELQAPRLLHALGDVHPSEPRVALLDRLVALMPWPAQAILGQSGADAVGAALKSALLATGQPGVIAFRGAYHGLSYAPLAVCGLRPSYREPFRQQLNPHVCFLDWPSDDDGLDRAVEALRLQLSSGGVGAIVVEPVLGRGGVLVPPAEWLPELGRLAARHGALVVADEIWTGLGRTGALLRSVASGLVPDIVCLGKGLGGGLPISACLGRAEVMRAWRREQGEVVDASTFAGAPLACTAALQLLDVVSREKLAVRAAEVGGRWLERLRRALGAEPNVREVRGAGLMIGVDLGERPGAGARLARALLERGWIVSTGGAAREVIVLTPPLTIDERLLELFVEPLCEALREA
jgi:4-aminobutyrate aminotransferase/(S)-3-amino-2-methylpropionate transaminase